MPTIATDTVKVQICCVQQLAVFVLLFFSERKYLGQPSCSPRSTLSAPSVAQTATEKMKRRARAAWNVLSKNSLFFLAAAVAAFAALLHVPQLTPPLPLLSEETDSATYYPTFLPSSSSSSPLLLIFLRRRLWEEGEKTRLTPPPSSPPPTARERERQSELERGGRPWEGGTRERGGRDKSIHLAAWRKE